MNITILLFDRFTALDAVGPYEVLQRIVGAKVTFVAKMAGPVTTDTKQLTMMADAAIGSVDETDVLVIPGGRGSRALETDDEVLAWVRRMHETSQYTTSVCTGSLVLAAAGLLDGLPATCHWGVIERLAEYGAKPTHERVVRQGKIFTAAGVSAGIDMALTLVAEIAGPPMAQAIQLGIEYDPAPPFDAGAPHKAPKEITELVRANIKRV